MVNRNWRIVIFCLLATVGEVGFLSDPNPPVKSLRKRTYRRRIALVILLGINLLVVRGCIWRSADDFHGSNFNRGTNGAWLSVDWVNLPHSDAEIIALSNDLHQQQIQYVFVFTTYLKPDGTFNSSYNYAEDFLDTLHTANPDLKILAWIGLPLDVADWGYVDLSRSEVHQHIADLSLSLISLGFDGIHLDLEPIHNKNEDVLNLLELIQPQLPSDKMLSIATPRIFPIAPELPIPLNTLPAWTADYYQQIGRRVDQIVVMTYDSGMPTAWLYRHWIKFQVIEVSQALKNVDVEVLIGISTSRQETNTHRPRAENIKSGLDGLTYGLNDRGTISDRIHGIAIYPYWETTDADWDIYTESWLATSENE